VVIVPPFRLRARNLSGFATIKGVNRHLSEYFSSRVDYLIALSKTLPTHDTS